MATGIIKHIKYLDLAVEFETERVPHDGRYYITRSGEVIASAPTEFSARVLLEMKEEAILEAEPEIRNPRDLIQRERQTREIMSARAQSAAVAKSKATAKGGKGGRSGV